MKQIPTKLSFAAAATIIGLGVQSIFAQTAPGASAAAAGAPKEETTVKLDPFKVSAESDVGFVAANSLAGGRMAMALKDTPVAYSVLTSEFLEAFNITDAGKASEFSVNTNQYVGDGLQGTSGNTTVVVRIRGQAANQPTRNFFPYNIASDTYNVDRLDFARGANSTLFGAGAAAGTLNTVTKQALTNKSIREVRLQIGTWDRYRATVDINQPVTDKFAVRTNLLWQSNNTWRMREWERRRGASLAATYNITPKFSVRAEAEYRITDKTTGSNRTKDQTSAWDGKFTPSGPDAAMTPLAMAVAGVSRSVQRFVIDGENRNVAYNIQNRFQTKNAQYNATTPNYLDGRVINTVGFNAGAGSMTDVWNPPMRFGAVFKGSPSFVLPDKTFTPLWDRDYKYPSGWERGKDVNLFFTYRPFEGLYIELSGDKNSVYRWTEYPAAGGMYDMRVDINRLNPDGTPNKFFLQPFSENSPFSFATESNYTNANLQTAYVKDTRYGKLQVGLMGGMQDMDQIKREDFFLLPLHQGIIPGADFRAFFPPNQDQNLQSVYTRQYTALRGTVPSRHVTENPLTVYDYTRGTRAVMTPHWYTLPNRLGWGVDSYKRYRYVQAVANVSTLKNHLVLIGAARRDFTRLATLSYKQSDDMPVGWDGSYMTPKASPPADYWTLTYVPKNAAGQPIGGGAVPAPQRPRSSINGLNVPSPQYANDRFQDDFSTPDLTAAVNTRSFGAVVNLWKGIGIYVNDSTTYDTNAGTLNVNMNLIPPTSSHSYDAGVRYTMPNGKLNFSFGWFKAFQQGASQSVGTTFFANNNSIADSPVIGDLSEGGRNNRGHPRFNGFSINSTITNETIGYESELTANLTPNWRLIVNYGRNTPMQKDVWPDVVPWIEAHDALYRQILDDSGIQINAQSQASIKPQFNDPTKINVDRVTSTVNAWNSLMGPTGALTTLRLTAATKNRQILNGTAGGPLYTYNVATDYRFQKGFLRGLRAGIAVNYRARSILGAKTNETIADPNNPNLSIASPTNDANNYLYGKAYYKGAANFSYTYRFKEANGRFGRYAPKTIQFDLAIDNLFDLDQVLEYSTTSNSTANSNILAPVNNDISQQAMILIPGAYNWQPPRSYTLTAKINF
ncbi:MAG: hypothetical protein EXS38_05870 [Opitutus sp.]|nr:hypothetical protein [Opitutus sp.]